MLLSKIVENIEAISIDGSLDIDISSLVYDSRKVEAGSLFVCMKGAKFDAHEKASEVVANGAGALIVEDDVDVTGVTDINDLSLITVSSSKIGGTVSDSPVVMKFLTPNKVAVTRVIPALL